MSGQAPAEDASPLGRYAPATPPEIGGLVAVHLLRTPLELLVAGREHHDGLMREFRLLALAGHAADHEVPVRLLELTDILGRQYAAASERRDAEIDAALARGLRELDLVLVVPPAAAGAARSLAGLMDEADVYCASADLLTLERPALLRRLGTWYLDEFVVQCEGGAPTPWSGPLTLDD